MKVPMLRNKQGALELSITGIVVLIIAITVLGLVIFFVKKTFGETTEIVGGQIQVIKKDLVESLRATGELLAINVAEIEANVGEPKSFVVAIQNTGSSSPKGEVCFRLRFTCVKAFRHRTQNTCSFEANGQQPIDVGGVDAVGVPIREESSWFRKVIGGGEVDIKDQLSLAAPVELLMKRGISDTYRVQLTVLKEVNNNNCASASQFKDYASKTFDVVLKA